MSTSPRITALEKQIATLTAGLELAHYHLSQWRRCANSDHAPGARTAREWEEAAGETLHDAPCLCRCHFAGEPVGIHDTPCCDEPVQPSVQEVAKDAAVQAQRAEGPELVAESVAVDLMREALRATWPDQEIHAVDARVAVRFLETKNVALARRPLPGWWWEMDSAGLTDQANEILAGRMDHQGRVIAGPPEPNQPICEVCSDTGFVDESVGGSPLAGPAPCPDCDGPPEEPNDDPLGAVRYAADDLTRCTAAFDRLALPFNDDAHAAWLAAIGRLRLVVGHLLDANPEGLISEGVARLNACAYNPPAAPVDTSSIPRWVDPPAGDWDPDVPDEEHPDWRRGWLIADGKPWWRENATSSAWRFGELGRLPADDPRKAMAAADLVALLGEKAEPEEAPLPDDFMNVALPIQVARALTAVEGYGRVVEAVVAAVRDAEHPGPPVQASPPKWITCPTCKGRAVTGGATMQANDLEWPCAACHPLAPRRPGRPAAGFATHPKARPGFVPGPGHEHDFGTDYDLTNCETCGQRNPALIPTAGAR